MTGILIGRGIWAGGNRDNGPERGTMLPQKRSKHPGFRAMSRGKDRSLEQLFPPVPQESFNNLKL